MSSVRVTCDRIDEKVSLELSENGSVTAVECRALNVVTGMCRERLPIIADLARAIEEQILRERHEFAQLQALEHLEEMTICQFRRAALVEQEIRDLIEALRTDSD
jgi:uncharacterized protein YuzE